MGRAWARYGLTAAASIAVVLGVSGWSAAGSPWKGESGKRETAICLVGQLAGQEGCAALIEPGFEASFSPRGISRSEQAPISLRVAMRFKTSDGSRPSPLHEFEISEDRHARLNLKGVPACPTGNVESPPIEQRCKAAEIGSGKMRIDIRFPEGQPIETQSRLTAYNRGAGDGTRTLLLVGHLTVPTPAEIVAEVAVKRSKPGRYKLDLVGSVPKIAGGSGSVTYLALRFRKGVFSATCEDRHLDTGFGARFVDGTFLAGAVSRSCTPSS